MNSKHKIDHHMFNYLFHPYKNVLTIRLRLPWTWVNSTVIGLIAEDRGFNIARPQHSLDNMILTITRISNTKNRNEKLPIEIILSCGCQICMPSGVNTGVFILISSRLFLIWIPYKHCQAFDLFCILIIFASFDFAFVLFSDIKLI